MRPYSIWFPFFFLCLPVFLTLHFHSFLLNIFFLFYCLILFFLVHAYANGTQRFVYVAGAAATATADVVLLYPHRLEPQISRGIEFESLMKMQTTVLHCYLRPRQSNSNHHHRRHGHSHSHRHSNIRAHTLHIEVNIHIHMQHTSVQKASLFIKTIEIVSRCWPLSLRFINTDYAQKIQLRETTIVRTFTPSNTHFIRFKSINNHLNDMFLLFVVYVYLLLYHFFQLICAVASANAINSCLYA